MREKKSSADSFRGIYNLDDYEAAWELGNPRPSLLASSVGKDSGRLSLPLLN